MNEVQRIAEAMEQLTGRVLVGKERAVRLLVVALLCEGHVLLEGVPGVAKTLLARLLARAVGGRFQRVQFTADLMPADILGTSVFDLDRQTFHLREGPVFTEILLADEINRAPARTQSALLEAMQERQVSIDGETRMLPPSFFVLATRNPIEHEGTYPLPEAALDRFFLRVEMGYPDEDEEVEILGRHLAGLHAPEAGLKEVPTLLDAATVAAARAELGSVHVEDDIQRFVARLVAATRQSPLLVLGASPRAAVCLLLAARAHAAASGRDYVIPDDVLDLAPAVLAHRLVLEASAEVEGHGETSALERCLQRVEVPR